MKLSALYNQFENWINNINLKQKLWGLYFFCVLIPLFLTDGVILYSLAAAENTRLRHAMENQANAVQYSINSYVESASSAAKSIYMNENLREFLNTRYETPYDYVVQYQSLMQDTLLADSMGLDDTKITIYADNDTIVRGGGFGRIADIRDTPWYRKLMESSQDRMLMFFYDDLNSPYEKKERKVLFLRRLNRILSDDTEKLLKIDINYGSLERNISSMNYEFPVCVCRGGELMFSSMGGNNAGEPFEPFSLAEQAGYEMDMSIYGEELQIYLLKRKSDILALLWKNLPWIALLLLINLVLPQIFMNLLGRSITRRIRRLSVVFEQVDNEELPKIREVSGTDEIGGLMENYNRMADRTNGLIQTVYKDKLKEQEINIARQNAELLALRSQINPHFLFNALESIRMHSILKQEFETAGMVEKLAVMERQNVDWASDFNTIDGEMAFTEAYLELQKYRFGDRLSYRLEVEKGCGNIQIPRLTVTTFVENACVHGIESKAAPGWIFVRIYKENGELVIEVEDTGGGMDEEELETLNRRMENASIAMLKENGRVGVVNACLRIRMMTKNSARFLAESEKGIGTIITIRIPLEKMAEDEKIC